MINLLFSGDFVPPDEANETAGADFSSIRELIEGSDLHITNLESPLTSSGEALIKTGPSIKASPRGVEYLKMTKVGLACLANNHIFDYGEGGLKETIEICEGNGIRVTGIISGDYLNRRSVIIEIKGVRIGFLNYCEHEFSVRERGMTGAYGFDYIDAFNDIRALERMTDRIIVLYHGGNEYYHLPRPDLKRDFHFIADLGADAVIGHHTHVFSGIEIYDGKPLVYSLGNFFFLPFEEEPESWHEGILCRLSIGESVSAELIPVIQCKNGLRVEFPAEERSKEILSEIRFLSEVISDAAELQRRWELYTSTAGTGLANQILYPSRADKLMLRIPWLRRHVDNPARLRSLINVLRCRSLEQLLIGNLKSRKW